MPASRPAAERFAEKFEVDASTGCWNWTAAKIRGGYGHFVIRHKGAVPAHHYAFEQANGPVPDGKIVRHTCHNPGCVNPAHLVLGTHADNMADMKQAGRRIGRNTGSALPRAALLRMKRLLAKGFRQIDVADALGIHRATVQRVIYRGDLDNLPLPDAPPRRKYLTEDERRAVLDALADGEPVLRVAERFGVDRKTIRNIRDRAAAGASSILPPDSEGPIPCPTRTPRC